MASVSRPARVRRVASSIMFGFSIVVHVRKLPLCSETIKRPQREPDLSPLEVSSGSNAASLVTASCRLARP